MSNHISIGKIEVKKINSIDIEHINSNQAYALSTASVLNALPCQTVLNCSGMGCSFYGMRKGEEKQINQTINNSKESD